MVHKGTVLRVRSCLKLIFQEKSFAPSILSGLGHPSRCRCVASLQEALIDPATKMEALEILRSLIDRVEVSADENGFAIELVGEIANMVRLSAGAESLGNEPYRSSVKVVAGARNHREFPICVAL
jgi:hypothetical protein